MATLKTLRVCLSKDLPLLNDRDPNFIYFLYDKLTVFLGQNLYSDPYAIVEKAPEAPIIGVLYFTLNDGAVKAYQEYKLNTIAKVESTEQLDILKKTGTTFFVNSQKKYLDLNRRIITLPFQNGTYELTVSISNELMLDKDTVIGFNPKTNEFEIVGNTSDHDVKFVRDYTAKDSNTISANISDRRLVSEVKISKGFDNILKLAPDGIFASTQDRVTTKAFNTWVASFNEYKDNMLIYMKSLSDQVYAGQEIVSPESISTRILKALESIYPEIDSALASFNDMASRFEGIENRVKMYADDKYEEVYTDLNQQIKESSDWSNFSDEIPEPEEQENTSETSTSEDESTKQASEDIKTDETTTDIEQDSVENTEEEDTTTEPENISSDPLI